MAATLNILGMQIDICKSPRPAYVLTLLSFSLKLQHENSVVDHVDIKNNHILFYLQKVSLGGFFLGLYWKFETGSQIKEKPH